MSDIPARPTLTKAMIIEAIADLAKSLDADAQTIADNYYHPMDGYELARELERYAGWDVDRSTMEELDAVEWKVSEKLKAAEQDWVDKYNIKPDLEIGQRVMCLSRGEYGYIAGLCDHSPACYSIKPEGQDDSSSGKLRWICKFEKVVSASEKEIQA